VITVVASIVVLSGPGGQMFAASALRGLRFFQVIEIILKKIITIYWDEMLCVDSSYGSYGSKRRHLETSGFCCLCPPTGSSEILVLSYIYWWIRVKNFWLGVGSICCCSGQVSHLWFVYRFGKISPKNIKFFNFFHVGSNKISSGRV